MCGEYAVFAFELGATVDGERVGGGVFGVGAGVFCGAIEDVIGGEEDEGNSVGGAGERERACVIGSFSPGVVGLAAVDVGGAGSAEDSGNIVPGDEAVELCGVGGDAFEIEMQPVSGLRVASGRQCGETKLRDELCAELTGGADDERAAADWGIRGQSGLRRR